MRCKHTFSDVAREVFNQSIITNGKVREHPSFEIQYNYEFIDDTYCNWEKPECTKVDHCHSNINDVNTDAVDGFDSQGKMSSCATAYTKNSAEIRMNHPLMVMVSSSCIFYSNTHFLELDMTFYVLSEREELLGHPLVVSLLHHKWKSYGKYVYYFGLIIYLSFVLFLTNYISSIDAPLYFKVNSSQHECLSVRLVNQTEEEKSNLLGFSENNKQWVSRLFMIITVFINVCKEVNLYIQNTVRQRSDAQTANIVALLDFSNVHTKTSLLFGRECNRDSVILYNDFVCSRFRYLQHVNWIAISKSPKTSINHAAYFEHYCCRAGNGKSARSLYFWLG